ncbi:MAG TPA: tetratricopeptide repeat protein [Drouetiella sp.]
MRLRSILPLVALSFLATQPAMIADSSNSASVQAANYTKNPDGENALDTGDYPRAQTVFSNALSSGGKKDPMTEGYLRMGLGEALFWQGSIPEATKEFNKANSLLKNGDAKLRAHLMDDFAYMYQAQAKMDDAVDAVSEALTLRKSIIETDPGLYIATAIHLVNLLDRTGQLDRGQKVATDTLKLTIEKFGPDSILAANLNDQLGLIYRKMGKQSAAQECFNEALKVKLSRNSVFQQYAPHPYAENVTFRFLDGSPNCMQKRADGSQWELTTAHGVTIAAAIAKNDHNFAKYSQINVRIRNETDKPIQILGQPPVLVAMTPKIVFATQIDPTKLADNVEKSGNKKAKWVRFWGENATQTLTSTMINGGGYWGGPYYGGYGGGYGGGFGGFGGGMPFYSGGRNNNSNMTIMNQQIPDYAAQARALEKAANLENRSQQTADSIRQSSLGASTLLPGQSLEGSLFYDQLNLKQAQLQLPIGNSIFEFEFPPR